ncbi:MAG: hypothetical protein V1865_02840 [bacterium]
MKKFIIIWIIFLLPILLLAQSSFSVKDGFLLNVTGGVKYLQINFPTSFSIQEIPTESGATSFVDLSDQGINRSENYLAYIKFILGYHVDGFGIGVGAEFNSGSIYSYRYNLSDPNQPCDGSENCGKFVLENQISPTFSINANYNISNDFNSGMSIYFPSAILKSGSDGKLVDIYDEIGIGAELNLEYLLFAVDENTDFIIVAGAGIGKSQEITFNYFRIGIGIWGVPPK